MMTRATNIAGLVAVSAVLATAGPSAQPSDVSLTEPLRCWWRTSVGAVAIGEPFEATVTCAVREGDASRVVPDESRLQPTGIRLAPFEVLSGSHPADLRTETHRFFQYRYQVRIIAPDVIGRDARFPDLQLHYRIHDRLSGDTVEGRDRIYLLPGQPIRVLSQVPLEADDIRDSSNADFNAVTTLRFGARALRFAALFLVAFGLLVLTLVVLRAVRQRSSWPQRTVIPVMPRAVLSQALTELTEVKRQSASGWTADLIARAASAVRIAATTGLGRSVAQQKHVPGAVILPGSLLCTHGWLRNRAYVVSSSITPGELARHANQLPSHLAPRRDALERLQRSLSAQTRVLYAAAPDFDGSALDVALTDALRATQVLRRAHAWPSGWLGPRLVGRSAEAEA